MGEARSIDVLPTSGPLNRRMSCRCGYDLGGLPVREDPHYGLELVQCSECGRISPVVEIPGGRASAALRVAGAVVLVLGLSGLVVGIGQSVGFAASMPRAQYIGRQLGWTPPGPNFGHAFVRVRNSDWSMRSGAFDNHMKGYGFDWLALTDLAWLLIACPIALVLLALLLPGVKARGLASLAAPICTLATLGLLAYYLDSNSALGWEYAMTYAEWSGGWAFAVATIGFAALLITISATIARSSARRLVLRIFGQPRASLDALWDKADRSV